MGAAARYNDGHCHDTGLAFSLMFPFAVAAPPILMTFAGMRARAKNWYINVESFELDFRREPDLRLTIDQALMNWIRSEADDRWNAGD